MIDSEKVVKGLECCMSDKLCNSPCQYKGQCDDGGYYYSKAIEDAIELLEAQKPRVMTLEDFENNPNVDQYGCLPCWMEYREEPKWDGWAEATVHTCVEYGRRPWTSRPTDEQREATPWTSDT